MPPPSPSLDARIARLLRVPPPPRSTAGDEAAVTLLREFGEAHRLPACEIAAAVNLLRGPNDLLIILLQPASTGTAYALPSFEAQIAASPTLQAVDGLLRTVSRGTRSLFTVSVADSSSFNVQPRGAARHAHVEPFRAQGHALLERILRAKRPQAALCLWTGGCHNELVAQFRGAGVGAPLREAGGAVAVDGHLVQVVRAFHPSFAVNFFPENAELQQLLLLDFVRAFSVMENRWREEEWIVELRARCRRFARSCGRVTIRTLIAAEEGVEDPETRKELDEESSDSDADNGGDDVEAVEVKPTNSAATRIMIKQWCNGKAPAEDLLTLTMLDLVASQNNAGDQLTELWPMALGEEHTDHILQFLAVVARGYGLEVLQLLDYFRMDIHDLARYQLLSRADKPRDRLLLADVLQALLDEASVGLLMSQSYFSEPWEWLDDPKVEAEIYYEHEESLATEREYAQRWRAEQERRERMLAKGKPYWQEQWELLFEKAIELVQNGPTKEFQDDLVGNETPPAVRSATNISLNKTFSNLTHGLIAREKHPSLKGIGVRFGDIFRRGYGPLRERRRVPWP